jgi:hypothetical protein
MNFEREKRRVFVQSFSEIAYRKMLSSDILYPSSVKESKRVEDKGSIRESIAGDDSQLFHVTKKTSKLYQVSCYVCPIARQVTLLAISVIVAPIGAVWHGAHAALLLAISAIGVPTGAVVLEASDKTDHLKACSTDALVMSIGLVALWVIRSRRYWSHNPEKWQKLSAHGVESLLRKQVCGAGFSLGFSALASWNPKTSAQLFTYEKERAGFYKSLCLKHDFGITSRSGHLLQYKSAEDNEGNLTVTRTENFEYHRVHLEGTFCELFIALKLDLVSELEQGRDWFPKGDIPFKQKPEDIREWINSIKTLFPNNEHISKLDPWLEKYTKLYVSHEKMRQIIKECINIKYNSQFLRLAEFGLSVLASERSDLTRELRFDIPEFNYNDFLRQGGRSARQPAAGIKKLTSGLPDQPADAEQIVKDFEERCRKDKGAYTELQHCAYMLGVDSDIVDRETFTEQDLIRGYRKLAVKIHPDKHNDAEYYVELFKILSQVHVQGKKALNEKR